mgnify:FL=1
MNEEVKEGNNTEVSNASLNNVAQSDVSNGVVTADANVNTPVEEVTQVNETVNSESSVESEKINIAPIASSAVHFDSKPEEVKSVETVQNSEVSVPVNNVNPAEAVTTPTVAPSTATPAEVTNTVNSPAQTTPSTPVNTSVDNKSGGEFIEKEKKKWPIVLVLVLLVLGGAFYYYYFILTKPSTLFNKVVETTYNKLSNNINTNLQDVTKNFKKGEFSGKLILTSENADLVPVNGLTVNAIIGYDKDNKKAYIGGSGSLLGIEMGDVKMMLDGDYVYFNAKTSSYQTDTYKMKVDTTTSTVEENSIDLEKYMNSYTYILDLAKKTFLANVSENKVTKTPEMKNVNGKKTPVYKINYTYDKDENDKIRKAVLNAFINDSKALEELVNLGMGETTDDVKTNLQYILDNETSIISSNAKHEDCTSQDCVDVDTFETINMVMYIDMFNSSLIELNLSTTDVKFNVNISGNSYNAAITANNSDQTTDTISLSYDGNENRYVLDVDALDALGSAMEKAKENTDTDYVAKNNRVKFSIVYKENKVNDKKIEYTLSVKYYEPTNTEKEYFVVDATGEINSVDNIKTIDTTNAIDFDTLTEEEKNALLGSLLGMGE